MIKPDRYERPAIATGWLEMSTIVAFWLRSFAPLPLVSEMKPRRWGLPSQTATSAAAAWFCRTMPIVNRLGHDVSWTKA